MRILKLHLSRTVGKSYLTVSEMTTVLVQVKAVLNSRPLTPLSEYLNDLHALTLNYFLIRENLQIYPDVNLREVSKN